jgi:AraC family transcriptional regulator of arabinose operon
VLLASGLLSYSPGHTFHRTRGLAYWTGVLLMRGSASFAVDGREHVVAAPSLVVVRPDVEYHVRYVGASGAWTEAFAFFSPERSWEDLLDFPPALPGLGVLALPKTTEGRAPIRAAFEAIALAERIPEHRDAVVENAIERILLLAQLVSPRPGSLRASADPRIRIALDAMRDDPGRRWSVPALAELAHVSPSRFAHLFTERMGVGPRRYLERQRMMRARDLLLTTNRSVQEIASEVGYDNPLHFSTRFRAVMGGSPREYRRSPTLFSDLTAAEGIPPADDYR